MVIQKVCDNVVFAAGAKHFRIVDVVAPVTHDAGWRTWFSRFAAGTPRTVFTVDSADAGVVRCGRKFEPAVLPGGKDYVITLVI